MPQAANSRLALAVLALLAEAPYFGGEALRGGFVSHHLLQRPDLPDLSNARACSSCRPWPRGQPGGRRRTAIGFALILAPDVARMRFPAVPLPAFVGELLFAPWPTLGRHGRPWWNRANSSRRFP